MTKSTMLLLGLALAAGCKDKAKDAAPAGGDPKAETKPAPKGTDASLCTPDHTKVEEQGFCVKVPKTWEKQPTTTNDDGSIRVTWFRVGEGGVFDVMVEPSKTLADMPVLGQKATAEGELAGGKGKWVLSDDGTSASGEAGVVGSKGLIRCGGSGQGYAATFEICKTILPL